MSRATLGVVQGPSRSPSRPASTGGASVFVLSHRGWPLFNCIAEGHRPAAQAFMAWCRRHPRAAEALVRHPRGLQWAGNHPYAEHWQLEHPMR